MRKLYAIFTAFLLASTIAFAEGESGCKWETIEETETYLQEKCGDGMARIRSKPLDSNIVYVTSEDAVEQSNEIVETSESVKIEEEIKKVEEAVENTAKKVEEVIKEKIEKTTRSNQTVMERRLKMGEKYVGNLHADEKLIEIAEEEEWNQVDEELKTWMRLYELLPGLILKNEKIKSAELDYEAAVELLKKTYSAYYPQVTITYGSNWEDDRTPSKSSTAGLDTIKHDSKHGKQKSITITQMIWDFGRTNSLIDIEKSKVQQAYFTLELAKEDLIIEAITAWLNLMKTYNVHEANKKIEANALKTLSMTIEKVKKGEASKLEQLQIEQQYRTFQTLTMTSQLAIDSAKQRFQNVWRFKPHDVANMPIPIADILGVIPDSGASVRGNTTLKIANLDIEIAWDQLAYDDAEFKPRLDGKLSYTEKENELGGAYDEQKEEWRADVTLSWKIFGGFSGVHQKRSDEAKLGSAELRYEDVVRIVNEQFNNAWNNYVLVEKNLETLKRTVEINKEMYSLTLDDFKAGNSPIMTVFGMKTTYIMSEVAYQNAQIDLLVARYQLHKVLGLVDPLFK
jgi:outer membrane protein TolC|tara:strand:+ start:1925 stop:3631 length:1707 start_codon:yes stop_codon:yes gene_type:complete